ncbi:MAG: DNA-binding protein [Candidatus Bathyarchaeota archaeon]
MSEREKLNIRDLKPGMKGANIKAKVTSTAEVQHVTSGRGIEYEIQESKVEDETGSITLVLWGDKIMPLKAGDFFQIENGFVTSFKGDWRINVGKYGKIVKI